MSRTNREYRKICPKCGATPEPERHDDHVEAHEKDRTLEDHLRAPSNRVVLTVIVKLAANKIRRWWR